MAKREQGVKESEGKWNMSQKGGVYQWGLNLICRVYYWKLLTR